MKWYQCVSVMAGLVLVLTADVARADVFNMGSGLTSLEFVTVGNPGNAADVRYHTTGFGAVGYVYAIGKYEVTAGQYTAFLNAVAATDTYGLYNSTMWSDERGCKIGQSGSDGGYTYSVASDRANRPVNFVSWGDAARFMNWLHNGQPTGAQGAGTTESGAYTLNGATTRDELMTITRNENAGFWIPSNDEWYKSAYHKNDGVTGNYWEYPTGSDSIDSSMANYGHFVGHATDVGTYEDHPSPYGTLDQGGNVWEWNEDAVTIRRLRRGGSWASDSSYLRPHPANTDPTYEYYYIGFRVATVPEPASITLVLCGAMAGALCWWPRRRNTLN